MMRTTKGLKFRRFKCSGPKHLKRHTDILVEYLLTLFSRGIFTVSCGFMSLLPTLPKIIAALKYQISHFILISVDDLDIVAICHFTTGIKQSQLHSELEFDHND